MVGGLSLFFLAQKNNSEKLLNWDDAQTGFPWGLIFLFGGGMALAFVVNDSGLALWLASLIPSQTYFFIILLIVITMVMLLTELASNLTTTVTFLPVVAAVAIQSDFNPILLTAAVGLAASCAFMLPVATPPNAIVFGSGLIRVPQMARAGFLINILGIIIVSFISVISVPYFLL